MQYLLGGIVWLLLAGLRLLPLGLIARLGRWGGGAAYFLDRRHRRVAVRNLSRCFKAEKSPEEIRALARENFRRIGENFACAVRTAGMAPGQIRQFLQLTGAERFAAREENPPRPRVVAIGHFGNFELYAHASQFLPGFQFATTYRALNPPVVDHLWQRLRARSGCLYFERRSEGAALRAAMHQQRLMIGFLADQHAGDKGLPLPFLGHDCSTSPAPAVFALRYNCPLVPAICYRVALARWRIEIGDPIPTHENGHPRSVRAISLDVNRAFEAAVRRDPANWFWVHNRWKLLDKLAASAHPTSGPALSSPPPGAPA